MVRWTPPGKKNKFNAKRTEYNGIRYDSKLEARYAEALDGRIASGEVVFRLRQVPLHLPGGVVYRCDFVEFHADGTVHFVDVKGMETPEFKIKKKIVEATYPIKIELVKRVKDLL